MNPIGPNPEKQRKEVCIPVEMLMDYAAGKVEGKQANALERHLAGCSLCADALEGIINFADDTDFLQSVVELNQKVISKSIGRQSDSFPEKPTARIITFPRIVAAIVSIAAILMVVVMVRPSGASGIAADYYETYPGDGVRGADSEAAMLLYNEGKFKEAAEQFSVLNDSRSQFFAGNAFMEIKEYDKAIVAYTKVLSINDSFLTKDAKYYLGLCYLFKGDTENGLKWMKEIAAEPKGDYSEKADEIIKALQ